MLFYRIGSVQSAGIHGLQETLGMHDLSVVWHTSVSLACVGSWGSSIILAAKPHQEQVINVDEFVWRMCVSYRRLNQVTLPFEYPAIPRRCDNAINNFGDSNGRLYFISLDNKTGYDQIGVRFADQTKLAFFGTDGMKYTFSMMPFGPRNAPAFYTCMVLIFRGEYDRLSKSIDPMIRLIKAAAPSLMIFFYSPRLWILFWHTLKVSALSS